MNGNLEWIFFDVGSTLVDESRAFQHRIMDAVAGTKITCRRFTDTMMAYYRQNKKGDLEQSGNTGWFRPPGTPRMKCCIRTPSNA